ncbi:helix-turn-helix transcriptional regulator [Amycolatopsis viridis]|uniref:ArsR family transcriptional regulator n=1 Tax=Amycolatopsis viridis TaxID=185678 RepID=A0ABX0SX19_9PSEU|nr:helix-turn-helix domain-containing protein [Amycolatopsis viridis]NIH81492.1 putative ArsR family transcriptional regulator [Amycolatopsis viridis]
MTEGPIRALAALDDELRRRMYAYIRQARRPVTRDEAAGSVGISRKLAAFHLDKLVAAGLLRARYEFVGERRGAGRTPKVYEPSGLDLRVSIPPRRPDLLADILLDAVVGEVAGETAHEAALRIARERGHAVGSAERERARPGRLGAERALTLAADVVEQHGFEPSRESPACLRLRNCPFHPLAAKQPAVVCGLNQSFLTGLLDGLGATTVEAALEPRAGECCVELRSAE